MLEKNKCKFIVMPCNTAITGIKIYKKIKVPLLSMPKEVFLHTNKACKKNSKNRYFMYRGNTKNKNL